MESALLLLFVGLHEERKDDESFGGSKGQMLSRERLPVVEHRVEEVSDNLRELRVSVSEAAVEEVEGGYDRGME